MALTFQPDPQPIEGPQSFGVGHDLRLAREATGKSVGDCAAQLRIRQPFLQALEEGRYKDLPGGAYAVGFLRTYAEFLGLDGEEMVRRFRQEASADIDARSELIFPSPMSEGRIPAGGILFVGLILAFTAYGGWYWLSSTDESVTQLAPPIPDRLSTVLNRPAQLTGEPKVQDAEPAKADEPKSPDDEPPKAAKEGEVVPPEESDDDKAAAPTKPEPVKSEPVKPEPVKPEPVKPEPVKSEPTKPEPVKSEPTKPEPVKPEPVKQEPAKPAESQSTGGAVYGSESPDSRVTLKASGDECWVQVRELDGQLLVSRLLRKGDSYRVPNRPGLILTVGNAGALDLLVDGKPTRTLGTAGQVKHDIKLDVDKLLSSGG